MEKQKQLGWIGALLITATLVLSACGQNTTPQKDTKDQPSTPTAETKIQDVDLSASLYSTNEPEIPLEKPATNTGETISPEEDFIIEFKNEIQPWSNGKPEKQWIIKAEILDDEMYLDNTYLHQLICADWLPFMRFHKTRDQVFHTYIGNHPTQSGSKVIFLDYIPFPDSTAQADFVEHYDLPENTKSFFVDTDDLNNQINQYKFENCSVHNDVAVSQNSKDYAIEYELKTESEQEQKTKNSNSLEKVEETSDKNIWKIKEKLLDDEIVLKKKDLVQAICKQENLQKRTRTSKEEDGVYLAFEKNDIPVKVEFKRTSGNLFQVNLQTKNAINTNNRIAMPNKTTSNNVIILPNTKEDQDLLTKNIIYFHFDNCGNDATETDSEENSETETNEDLVCKPNERVCRLILENNGREYYSATSKYCSTASQCPVPNASKCAENERECPMLINNAYYSQTETYCRDKNLECTKLPECRESNPDGCVTKSECKKHGALHWCKNGCKKGFCTDAEKPQEPSCSSNYGTYWDSGQDEWRCVPRSTPQSHF